MKSLDEIEEELDSKTNEIVGELWNEVNSVIREMDDFHSFLAMWKNEVEKYFGKCEIKYKYKLKGKKEWFGEQ